MEEGLTVRYAIIGNGIAGIKAAETIRKPDRECGIVIIAGETFPPYCRPMIGLFLGGNISAEKMVIRRENFYASQRIEPIIGQWVHSINVERQETFKHNTYSGCWIFQQAISFSTGKHLENNHESLIRNLGYHPDLAGKP